MADVKISGLPASTTPLAGTEVLPIVQSATTKQVSVANLTAGRAVSAASLALTTTPLPITSGGTGTATAFTAGSIVFAGASGVYTQDNANLFWDDAANELGIGTTNPIEKLGVNGSVRVTLDNQGMYFNSSTNAILGDGTNHTMSLYTNNAERINIASNGIITMGAYGAGAATFSAAGVISSVSDETWKTKDGVPNNPDVMLQKLEPGYWFYNEEKAPTFGEERQLGFYAQNVNAAIGPEAAPTPETYTELDENGVEVTKTKPWGYYDRSVLAVAVMSLKNALTTIEDLKQRIEVLENK